MAILLDPQNANPYLKRGEAYYFLGEPERAILDYGEAITLDPQDAQSYARRAVAYTRLENGAAALQDVERAAALGYDRDSLEDAIKKIVSQQ